MAVDLIKNLRINEKTKKISFYLADGNMEPIKYCLINDKNSEETFEEILEGIVYSIAVSGQYMAPGMSKSSIRINYAKIIVKREMGKWLLENISEKMNEEHKKYWLENIKKEIYYDFHDALSSCNRKIEPELKMKAKQFFTETIVPLFCKEYNREIKEEAYCINRENGKYLYSVTMDRNYPAFVSTWKEAYWAVPHDYKTATVLAEKMKSNFYFKEKNQ